MAVVGGGHLTRGAGIPQDELSERILTSTDNDLRYYLMKWIRREKDNSSKIIGNWRVDPTNWWERGREKDYKILFGITAPESEKRTNGADIKKSH